MTDDYPNLWKRGVIQKRIRERAGHCCEECGIRFHEGTNIAVTARNKDGKPTIGTVHHIDGNPQNCRVDNLVYLCQKCHLKVQWAWAPGQPLPRYWGNEPPLWVIVRKLDWQPPAQLWIPELDKCQRF